MKKLFGSGGAGIVFVCFIAAFVFTGCPPNDPPLHWEFEHLSTFGSWPEYSPDGVRIAFGGVKDDTVGIWLYTFGQGVSLLWQGNFNYDYDWSPDGMMLAFSDPGGSTRSLWVTDLDGNAEIIAENGRNPDWSPDGTTIVFQHGYGVGLYSIPSAGGTVSTLADSGEAPLYSPDGEQIAFSSGFGMACRIYLLDVSNNTASYLAYGGPDFDWSPDGTDIVYDIAENMGGYVYNNIRVTSILSPSPDLIWQGGSEPKWSPDGHIVFRSMSGFAEGGLIEISPSGGNAEQITSTGNGQSFNPAGNKFAFSIQDYGIYLAVKND